MPPPWPPEFLEYSGSARNESCPWARVRLVRVEEVKRSTCWSFGNVPDVVPRHSYSLRLCILRLAQPRLPRRLAEALLLPEDR